MFDSHLESLPYHEQKRVLAKKADEAYEKLVKPLIIAQGGERMLAVMYVRPRIVWGDYKNFQNFTVRLVDEVKNDVPTFENILRKIWLKEVKDDPLMLQACIYRQRDGSTGVSYAFIKGKTLARLIYNKTETEDVRHTGQPVTFRRLKFSKLPKLCPPGTFAIYSN